MTLVSSQAMSVRGERTFVSTSAESTVYSRITSCAVGRNAPRGGRRSTQSFPPRVMKNVSHECPAWWRSTSSRPEPPSC